MKKPMIPMTNTEIAIVIIVPTSTIILRISFSQIAALRTLFL
jgi:hypothetical protein